MKLHHCVIVRSDLPIGTQFAMNLHAAGESFGLHRTLGCVCRKWESWTYADGEEDCGYRSDPNCAACLGNGSYRPIVHAVALYARGERELFELEQQLIDAKIEHRAIREPDAPWHGQLMSIGIRPQPKDNYHRFTKRFQLVK